MFRCETLTSDIKRTYTDGVSEQNWEEYLDTRQSSYQEDGNNCIIWSYKLYSSQNIQIVKWVGQVVFMKVNINAYKVLVGETGHLEGPGITGRIVLKWISVIWMVQADIKVKKIK
jgi:hypothetical protein